MPLAAPPAPSAKSALSLDWVTQKSKEDALTLAVLKALSRYFGPSAKVRALGTIQGQARGDFLVVLPDGTEVTIEGKFEDYPATWFLEPLQLTSRVSHGGRTLHIEEGWVYKSPAHFLLYVSTVTGLAVLVPRRRVLEIQVPMLQALMLASRDLDVPLLLNGALNPVQGRPSEFNRAGVGYALLRDLVLKRYLQLYGQEGLHILSMRNELADLKNALLGDVPSMQWWLERVVLTESFAIPRIPGLALLEAAQEGQANPLHGLGSLGLSNECISMDGFRFFQAAVAQGFVSGQTKLLAKVAGHYLKRPGTYREGQELAWVGAPLPSADFAPGNRGDQRHHGFQRQYCADFDALLEELRKEGLQGRREAYLLAARQCVQPAVPA